MVKYKQGSFGRVFVLKFEDKDDLLGELKKVAAREKIMAGTIMLLGGLRSAGIVTGPKEAAIPPDPLWVKVSDGREIIGFGTLFWNGHEPAIHLHGAVGRDRETITGCIRRESCVYLVVEAIITEILGIDAMRTLDEKTGLVLLEL